MFFTAAIGPCQTAGATGLETPESAGLGRGPGGVGGGWGVLEGGSVEETGV